MMSCQLLLPLDFVCIRQTDFPAIIVMLFCHLFYVIPCFLSQHQLRTHRFLTCNFPNDTKSARTCDAKATYVSRPIVEEHIWLYSDP